MKTASLIGIVILTLFVANAFGAEKAKLATAVRDFSGYNLLIMATALKAGAVDAAIIGLPPFADFKARGEFRDIGRVEDFIPVEWMDHVLFARKDFLKDNPDVVKRMVKAILQSVDFVRGNSQWAIDKLQKETGFTKGGARLAYEDLKYTRDGKVNLKELENVRNFMIEYGLTSRDKTPPVAELYTGGVSN